MEEEPWSGRPLRPRGLLSPPRGPVPSTGIRAHPPAPLQPREEPTAESPAAQGETEAREKPFEPRESGHKAQYLATRPHPLPPAPHPVLMPQCTWT